jgi:hypothetical protein
MEVSSCHESLERDDLRQVMRARDIGTVHAMIEELQSTAPNRITQQELAMLPLSIAHLEELASVFETSLDGKVSSSTCWGTLYLVIKVRGSLKDIPYHPSHHDHCTDIKHVTDCISSRLSNVEGLGAKG